MKKLSIYLIAAFIAVAFISKASEGGPESKRAEAEKHAERLKFEKMKAKLEPLMIHDLETLQLAVRLKIAQTYLGARIVVLSEEPKFLGTIGETFDIDSIFNPYCDYGSPYSIDSIWNPYGVFGSPYGVNSPWNAFSVEPPAIVKNGAVIGYLTKNKLKEGAVDPDWLKQYFQ